MKRSDYDLQTYSSAGNDTCVCSTPRQLYFSLLYIENFLNVVGIFEVTGKAGV